MSLEENIKHWVKLDDQLKQITNNAKELKQQKEAYETSILTHIYTNKLNSAIVKITGGKLKFVENKQTNPITLTFLETCLNTYLNNPKQVENIMIYIKQQRPVKYIKDIKRFYE
jgi:hypothetical protein